MHAPIQQELDVTDQRYFMGRHAFLVILSTPSCSLLSLVKAPPRGSRQMQPSYQGSLLQNQSACIRESLRLRKSCSYDIAFRAADLPHIERFVVVCPSRSAAVQSADVNVDSWADQGSYSYSKVDADDASNAAVDLIWRTIAA